MHQFISATFKDPAALHLDVKLALGAQAQAMLQSPYDKLALAIRDSLSVRIARNGSIGASVEYETLRAHAYSLAELVRLNKKIEAIKLLRTVTGCGLKEAKDEAETTIAAFVAAGDRVLREQPPGQSADPFNVHLLSSNGVPADPFRVP